MSALALALDFVAIALGIRQHFGRRIYQLISGARDLPNYLVANPGINSGLMIPHIRSFARDQISSFAHLHR